MKLRNPFFIDNISDQPYFSMYLISPFCTGVCEGCQNKHLLKAEIKDYSINDLIEKYKNNIWYEGITVAGLEIFDSDIENDLIDFIKKAEIKKVTIYTRYERNSKEVKRLIEKMKQIKTVKEFYIKTGCYIKGAKEKTLYFETIKWEIKLASDNQNFERVI